MGGTIYIQNLAKAIAALPAEEKVDLKLSVAVAPSNLGLVEPIAHCVDQVYTRERLYLKLCKELSNRLTFLPPKAFNLLKLDFLYPTLAGNRSPYTWGAWIPDFQHHYLPELFSKDEINQRNIHNQKIANNAPLIVLSSKIARADFNRHYPEAASRSRLMTFVSCMESTWLQPNPELMQQKYKLPDRYFLVSNQFWKHKNHTVIIEALGLLKEQKIHPVVACTGKALEQDEYYQRLIARAKELGVVNQVRILGLIPRLDQIQLMRRCLAIIQPSLFEGWSTVVEDSRALGKPIILSNFPVHLEQNPPNSFFFEGNNAEQLAYIIKEATLFGQPGPDYDKEKLAQAMNQELVVEYGRRFLEIAQELINKPS